VPPPLRASLHGIAGLAAHLAGDSAGTAAHADQFKVALTECQIRPKPRMTPEGIIVQAVVTDDPAALQELLDSPPGFGTDKTMAAFAQLVLARELLRHHDARGTADRLAAADRLLAECRNPMGLTDLRDQVASSLQEPVPAAPPTPVDLLSERELLVVQYLRSELTLREIADDLFLSVNTVKTHARHIYRKLGVSGRQEAAAVRLPAVQVGHETGEAS
jgi:DNA-binding CsgD family transcriptional regulator